MRTTLKLLAVLLACTPALAADWPQFRGPKRDGVSAETGLLKSWPKDGPKLLWKTNKAGAGLSGMAIVGEVVYTMGVRGTDEYAIAFSVKDGKQLWETKLGPVFTDKSVNQYSYGPNMTPTVAGDHVFAVTSKGLLACLDKKGEIVWKKDIPTEMKGSVNPKGWGPAVASFGSGYCWSPILVGDKLLIAPGGKDGLLALLDAKTGKQIWRSKAVGEEATYGSPAVGKVGGQEMAFYVSQKGFHAISMKDGSSVFNKKRDEEYPDVVCAMPHVVGDKVYYTVGYGAESTMLEWDGKTFKDKWESKELLSKQGGTVILGKHIYGFHEDKSWMCQDLETGKKVWPPGRLADQVAATVIAADGRLYFLEEAESMRDRGKVRVGVMEASPKAYSKPSYFKLPEEGKHASNMKVWTHPSLADGKLYLRDQEWLFCYEVKDK